MLKLSLMVPLLLLMAACVSGAGVPMSICDFTGVANELSSSERVRIRAVFVPDARHGAYFTAPECPAVVVPVAFPDRSNQEDFFDAAYSGGGATTKLKVDATVIVESVVEGDVQSVVLKIERVHDFTDVSVIRPPKPQ